MVSADRQQPAAGGRRDTAHAPARRDTAHAPARRDTARAPARRNAAHAPARRNAIVALACAGAVAGMVGLAYAAVPLYDLFCRVTGYGGTTQTAAAAPAQVLDRRITIRFDAGVARDMAWRFQPVERQMSLRVGETALAFYRAVNDGPAPVTGTATFNVTPLKAGQYFSKIECFCFTEQTLAPGQSVDMPVQFFVDPAIAEDRNLDDVKTITLSYTFFRQDDDSAGDTAADAAAEADRVRVSAASADSGAGEQQ